MVATNPDKKTGEYIPPTCYRRDHYVVVLWKLESCGVEKEGCMCVSEGKSLLVKRDLQYSKAY